MKKNLIALFLTLTVLMLSGSLSSVYSAAMTDYCQDPPLIPQPIDPNILFVLDTSGSMEWCAYYYNNGCDSDHDGDGILDHYNPTVGYEGYFTPDKFYTDVGGIYQENPNPGVTCTCTCTRYTCRSSNSGGCDPRGTHGCSRTRYACCTAETCSGACDALSGNYLNYAHMQRIDLLRWAMTGGSPASCGSSSPYNTPNYCDPELYSQSGNDSSGKVGTVCSDTLSIDGASELGGCILEASDGTKVKVPWTRVYDSLAFKFVDLELRPRMGAMFFGGSGVLSNQLVYVGDATTAAGTINLTYPYMNLITKVNAVSVANSTPTGPAMWDAYNYFSQNDSDYGGFAPMPVGSTTQYWKNPMYVCDQTGLSCQFVPCAGNYVILVSDGQWNTPDCSITPLGSDPCTSSSSDPVVPAYCMHKSFINKSAPNDSSGNPTTTRVNGVYTVGLFMGGSGITAMENTAMYGSFDNNLLAWPGGTGSFPVTTCSMTDCGSGSGSGCVAVPSSHADWDKDSNGVPDTFFSASNALEIKDSIITSILDILQQATSGTAVSILASGEGSGANLLQAFFYPRKSFSDTDVTWVGEMQNLWYYLDPKLQVNTIREDTDSDRQLELKNDNIVHFRFDTTLNKTRADRYKDVNGDGSTLMFQSTVDLEQTKNLWEAGKTLWSRNLSTSPRTLFTTTSSSYPFSQLAFSPSSAATLKNYLQAATNAEATDIINYVGGTDISGYRPRTAAISPDPTPKVWKLGDIVSSTPKVESWIKINGYNLDPPAGYGDDSYQKYLDSIEYKSRGMVFVGANDGMLHAFKLGSPVPRSSTTDKFLVSQLCDDINGNGKCDADELGTTLGQETWSYVPKNALPYLKYLGDPNYCHLFYVDETPYLVDASINMPSDCITGVNSTCPRKTIFTKDALGKDTKNLDMDKTSWRTIVIGGMGQGGACRKGTGGLCATGNCSHTISTSCSVDANCPAGERCLLNCVKTPIMDPSDNAKGLGYSSYFALDVTNPGTPSLLWEFSEANIPDANKGLGFSTSGPVIVRTGARDQNGNWYAVFASGPTGPIDTGLRQFLGKSDQNLKLFVLDLKTGALLRTIDTGLSNAFGGSLSGANVDTDRWRPDRTGNYQDDVFYVGYTQWSGTSWIGGVLRVSTKESDPGNWVASTVISGIGPVTSSVAHLQDRTHHSLWLFFGTGRYFYKIGTDIDDADSQRRIYGIKDPCYNADTDAFLPGCTSPAPGLTDSTTSPPSAEPDSGWFINLDPSGTSYTAEREITNPLAASTSAVFFTTFAPTADICGYGGNSYVWAVNYSTGGAPSATALQGSALIQVSTGEIKELSLSAVFTDKIPSGAPIGPGGIPQGRRTPAFSGVPPIKGAGLSVITNPRPVKKVLHMQER